MVRSTRQAAARSRGASRDRHGRGIRSSITGPHLPLLRTRIEQFEATVASAAEYLVELWPDELASVHFEVADLPVGPTLLRWRVNREERRVTIYRLTIERFGKLHRPDELHRRMLIESCVFRAVAELLGKDPWELAPDRFGDTP